MTVSASTPTWTVAQASSRDCQVPRSFRPCRSSRLRRFSPQSLDPKTETSTACRFVAPCSRSWGSPGFRLLYGFWPPADLVGPLFEVIPTGVHPSKLFPLQQPSARHRAPLLRRGGPSREGGARSPSGVPSRRWSVASPFPCCHGFVLRVLDLKAFIHRRVRCRYTTFPSRPARCSHGLWIDSFGCLPRAKRRPARQGWSFHRGRFQTASASVATRVWRGRQDLGLSGSERADAGTDPKVGGPPARLAGSPKTATLPVRPVAPKGRPGSVASASVVPKVDLGRARIRTPKGSDLSR